MATYTASKAYVLSFTQMLAAELADTAVRIQAVLPARSAPSCGTSPGFPLAHLDPEIVMSIDDAVDAALAGLDAGELITIPSLPDAAHWDAYEAARLDTRPEHVAARARGALRASGDSRAELLDPDDRAHGPLELAVGERAAQHVVAERVAQRGHDHPLVERQ